MPKVIALDIQARSGGWLRAPRGSLVTITDTHGSQIADMFAVSAADFSEHLGAAHTRGATRKLFPRVGDAFFSTKYRPMLSFVADTSPGVHDMLWRACDAELYGLAGWKGPGEHTSCNANFRKAAGECGWVPEEVPDPVDWFQNTPFGADGLMTAGRGPSRPGDKVVLRAEMDLIVIVSACSWDMGDSKINGDELTGVRLEVEEPETAEL
ncbi:hypothetical protein DFJ74DRAFT_613393 [Hyaloraphidium curvatum]|nr:hypothetical protein DFJ74DRAFT_613393 [Hyaloraphidium curvatum]